MFKKGLLWMSVLILFSFFFPNILYSQATREIGELKEIIQNKNLREISISLEKTGSWSKIVAKQSIDKLPMEEQEFQKKVHELVQPLFKKIQEFENQYGKNDIKSLTVAVETYSKIGKTFKKQGGYINLVLAETVYRLGLSHLASFLRENPKEYQRVYNLWQKFERPFYDISNIVKFCEEELSVVNVKNEIGKFPNSISYSINKIIPAHFKMKASEEFSVDDPYKMFSTTYLMNSMDMFIFLLRMGGTDIMLEISIPGAVEYLKRGGKIEYLPKYWKDVRPFEKIMEGCEKMRANFSGDVGPLSSQILFLTEEYKKKEEKIPNVYIQ